MRTENELDPDHSNLYSPQGLDIIGSLWGVQVR